MPSKIFLVVSLSSKCWPMCVLYKTWPNKNFRNNYEDAHQGNNHVGVFADYGNESL